MTNDARATTGRQMKMPLPAGTLFTLIALGFSVTANLVMGGFHDQLKQLLMDMTDPSILAPVEEIHDEAPADGEAEEAVHHDEAPLTSRAEVADYAYEEFLFRDFFPQSLFLTVYIFLVSLFIANAPRASHGEKTIVTWMVGVGGIAFIMAFLVNALTVPIWGRQAHEIARLYIFPIPALAVGAAFGRTTVHYFGELLMHRRAK